MRERGKQQTQKMSILLGLLLVLVVVTEVVHAREIRIFPVPVPVAPCAVVAGTTCDLVRAAAGFAPTTGPDAGIVPLPGDTLVLAPGTYTLASAVVGFPGNGTGPVLVPGAVSAVLPILPTVMNSLEIRSRDGREITVIDGGALGAGDASVIIAADNVRIGGDAANQGLTIQNTGRGGLGDFDSNGILIGTPTSAGASYLGAAILGAGQADEDIIVQNNFIQFNVGNGIEIKFAGGAGRSIENFRFRGNEFRANTINGVGINLSVLALGGSSEDEGIFFIENVFDSNTGNGVFFGNTGDHEQIVFQNNIVVRNGESGVVWNFTVTQLEDILFEGNLIQRNGFTACGFACVGVLFFNSGQIENLRFIGNRDADFEEGITGNAGAGVLFASALITPRSVGIPLPGIGTLAATGGVQDIDDLVFHDNVINANGMGVATGVVTVVAGGVAPTGIIPVDGIAGPALGGVLGSKVAALPYDGVAILNAGDINDLVFTDNNIRLNAGAGVTIGLAGNDDGDGVADAVGPGDYVGFALPGDFDGALIENNVFWNNGRFCAEPLGGATITHGDGFAAFIANDINDIIFRDNEATENCNNGIFLSSTGNDITNTHFYNNKLNKNGLGVAPLGAGTPSADGLEISTFGDINDFLWDGGEANNNGGSGVQLDANNNTLTNFIYGVGGLAAVGSFLPLPNPSTIVAVNLADIDEVLITNAEFLTNGGSAPIGGGNGIIAVADKITSVDINNTNSSNNDDHGVLLSTVDDMNDVVISDSVLSNNDRNRDSVGSGAFFDTTDDMDNTGVINVVASGNHVGIRFDVKGENGRTLFVRDSTANDNDEEGILVDGSDDLSDIEITGNGLARNNVGITLRATDRGSDLIIDDNNIEGDNGTGIGIQLQAIGVSVTNNSIRKNRVGIDADRAKDSTVNGNNIARNEDFGIDAVGLKPGEVIDATNNWWGEPSGPKNASNPNGLGDRVSGKVNYEPFAGEPVVPTDVNFQIISFDVPDTVEVGGIATITATIRNNGSQEGSQNVQLKIEGSDFIDSNRITRTLNPATEVDINFDVVFPRGGTFTVTLTTQNDTQSAEIVVTGSTSVTIESVCDANSNSRIDDDDEILTCIGFWVSGDKVPGTGQSISDAKIKFLIKLWVTNGNIGVVAQLASW